MSKPTIEIYEINNEDKRVAKLLSDQFISAIRKEGASVKQALLALQTLEDTLKEITGIADIAVIRQS